MTDLKTAEIAGARKKAVSAAGIGNFVEWFDFDIYAQFITIISMKFFPSDNPTASLLSGFAAFAVGFLARPIGGIIFGNIGDRVGRRTALSGAVLLMSGATVAIGLTPSYESVGLLAPVLLVAWRILQGLSAGGEYAGSGSFIIEYAPSHRRALFGAVNPMSVALGTAAGATVGLVVTQSMNEASLESWGWRIPFILAGPVGLVGLYLRLKIQETPEFEAVREAAAEAVHPPIVRAFQEGLRPMIVVFAWSMVTAVSFYLLGGYMVAYNTEELGLGRVDALTSYIVALLVFAISCPLTGLAADRWGRRPVAIAAAIGLAVAVIPSFHIMGMGGLGATMLGQGLYGIFAGAIALITPVIMVELFRPEIRYTASALAYNMAFALLGGTAPLVATWLIARTGDPISPAYYVVLFAAVGLVAVLVGLKGYYAKDSIRSLQMGTEADKV